MYNPITLFFLQEENNVRNRQLIDRLVAFYFVILPTKKTLQLDFKIEVIYILIIISKYMYEVILLEYMQFFLAICGGISLVVGAIFSIVKLIAPAINVNKRVIELERKSDNDYKALQEIEDTNNALCKAMLALLNHSIDGNGIEYMKQIRSELELMLINR